MRHAAHAYASVGTSAKGGQAPSELVCCCHRPMTIRLVDPVDVVVSPDLTITEYIGRIASQDAACSACVATVTAATKEAPQRPAFDEYVLILEGEVHIMHGEGLTERTVVKAGQGFVLPAGTRVQWVWPGVWLLHAHAARRARKIPSERAGPPHAQARASTYRSACRRFRLPTVDARRRPGPWLRPRSPWTACASSTLRRALSSAVRQHSQWGLLPALEWGCCSVPSWAVVFDEALCP